MDNDKYIGRLLDNRYEILGVIGTGGMAVVYKARCHRLNRLVAIKILKDDLSQDEEFRRRFHAESQAVAMLSHPNIMSVYDVSTNDEADYIVMELIDGISLKQYMEKKGVLNWKETLHFSMQIAKALEHAHSRGIVHRDIKPHNIMVLKNGSVKVTDFGIARIMSKSNTLTKEALGSVHYISPEQAKGGRVDNRSDLYSLGVVMYEMMTGRAPYDGESPVSVAIQHINGGAAMPSTLNPNIPGGLEQIIMRLMAGDPGQRYATATNLLYDMEEFRKDPTVLFDFNHTPMEAVLKDHPPVVVPPAEKAAPRSTAERVAGARPPQAAGQRPRPQGTAQRPQNGQRPQGASGQRPQGSTQRSQSGQRPVQGQQTRQLTPEQIQRRAARQQEKREQEEKRTRMITMAVIGCSVVAVLAIIIFLWMLFNGGLFGPAVELLPVPDLVGLEYETLDRDDYAEFTITLADYGYSDEYDAGQIMAQTPEAEDRVAEGTEIKVYVSQGSADAEEIGTMEDLTGTTEQRAIDYLNSLDGDLKVLPKPENSDTVEEGLVISTVPAAGEPLHRGQTVTIMVSAGKEIIEGFVPVVEGKSYTEAVKALNAKGFMNILPEEQEESAKPIGEVITQSAEPGSKIDVTTEITLTVSKGLKMPNVEGKSFADAEKLLLDMGFTQISQNTEDSNETKDTVLGQSVSAGSYCDASSKIILTVSNGIATKQVPNVIGKTLDDAKKTLNDAGFTVITTNEVDNSAPKGQVVDQSIKSGTNAKVTDQIVLSISKGPQDVTKKVTINLPSDLTEAYVLTIMLADKEIYSGVIQPGTPSVTVEMTGRGVVQYEVFIDNLEYKTDKVDFNS